MSGLIHIYTGDGKGKTTSALGLALRALGWGAKVCMIQFIKGYSEIGEIKFAKEFGENFNIYQFSIDIARCISDEKVVNRCEEVQQAMDFARDTINSGLYDLVILDEINNAVHFKLIEPAEVIKMLGQKPDNLEVVLTGRNAHPDIIEIADYVTEMKLIKHPYQKNISARKMIDY